MRATPNPKPGPVRRPRQRHSATLPGCASGTVPQFEWTKSRGPVTGDNPLGQVDPSGLRHTPSCSLLCKAGGALYRCGGNTACNTAFTVGTTLTGDPELALELDAEEALAVEAAAAAEAVTAEEVANEGVYVIRATRGTYVGQSGDITARFSQHLIENGGRFTQAELDAAERVAVTGGKTAREIAEQQKIDELGGVDALMNIRNPIGLRRLGLMPQPYLRP